ncbi:MAG: helix-turn-helix transcriptional regulator, partial [Ruminococcus sp.]|nr:helix-turn-helix transcriptional regulator [Ruminococcus sp.]
MDDFKKIVAENIIKLRTSLGMTQAQLGEELSYSDKSVSKWERGESIPDVYVLKH